MAIFWCLYFKMGFEGFPGVVTYKSYARRVIESILSSFRGYFGFFCSFTTAEAMFSRVRRVLAKNRFFDYISKS